MTDGVKPSEQLLILENALNDAFDSYRDLYFQGGVSSVYLWDLENDENGRVLEFAGAVLIKKEHSGQSKHARWDSIHVFQVSNHTKTAVFFV